jgi:transcriptional regulator with XRE-family HTH domain
MRKIMRINIVYIYFSLVVMHSKNTELAKQFSERFRKFRLNAGLTILQVHIATGISKRQLNYIEAGSLSPNLNHLDLYAKLFGMELHSMLDFSLAVPDESQLKAGIINFLKAKGHDPELFFKPNEGLTVFLQQMLSTNFLNTPKYSREIVKYCEDKYGVKFTTTGISKVMDNFYKEGLIQKLETDKKTKFQYKKK